MSTPKKSARLATPGAFRIEEFTNPRTGTTSFRVEGRINRERFRKNFPSLPKAEAYRAEMEARRHGHRPAEIARPTWLAADQLRLAEVAFTRLSDPKELGAAIDHWLARGKREQERASTRPDIRLDDAVAAFCKWLDDSDKRRGGGLRPPTRKNLFYRAKMFASEVGNLRLSEITPEVIEAWRDGRNVSMATRRNDVRAISRFLGWCCEREQRFLTRNPAADVRHHEDVREEPPAIYTLPEIRRLLTAAKRFRGGRFLSFIVLQLFGGLRPTEALRFQQNQIVDERLRLEAKQTKTGQVRVIEVDPLLSAWLAQCPKDEPVSDPQRSKLLWGQLRAKAKLSRWIPDGLRHVAISNYFKRSGSYGQTAQWAGNSESIIRKHYDGLVSAKDCANFWNLYPLRSQRLAARQTGGEVIAMPRRSAA